MLRCCILSTQTIVGRQMLNSIVVVRMFCLPSAQLNAGVSVSIINPRSSRTSISANNFINIYNAKHSKYSKNGGADCKWNRISSRRRWCSCNYLCVFMWARNIAIFELAEKYKKEGMAAYSKIQENEFAREKDGYTSVKHQREVGTSYFDAVSNTISSGKSSTTAMEGSTESEQF